MLKNAGDDSKKALRTPAQPSTWIPLLLLLVLSSSFVLGKGNSAVRDPQAIEILNRAVQAAGGTQALSSIRDMTETGQIELFWGDSVGGDVTVLMLGGDHFRMDTDLPTGKHHWILRNGSGMRTEGDGKDHPFSDQNAIDLARLTFPIGHAVAALADSNANISFIGIEQRQNRSVYRVRLAGTLGIVRAGTVTKDLIIDALTFDLVAINDCQITAYKIGAKSPTVTNTRQVEFGNFQVVNGVRIPFSVDTRLMGERTLAIDIKQVEFNKSLGESDF